MRSSSQMMRCLSPKPNPALMEVLATDKAGWMDSVLLFLSDKELVSFALVSRACNIKQKNGWKKRFIATFSTIKMNVKAEEGGNIRDQQAITDFDASANSLDYKKLCFTLARLRSIERSKELVPWQWYCLTGEPVVIQHAIGAGIITEFTRSHLINANPLHYAAFSGSPHAVKCILEAFPQIDPSEVDNNRATVLHYAVASRSPEVVAYLHFCELGLNPRTRNSSGQSAMDYAWYLRTDFEYPDMIRAFMQENPRLTPYPNRSDGVVLWPRKDLEIYSMLFHMDPDYSAYSEERRHLKTCVFLSAGYTTSFVVLSFIVVGLGCTTGFWLAAIMLFVGTLAPLLIAAMVSCIRNGRLGYFDSSPTLFHDRNILPPLPRVAIEPAGIASAAQP